MLAAAYATPEAINLMAREARGLLCAPMDRATADRLGLPLMVAPERNTVRQGTAFTRSVARHHTVDAQVTVREPHHRVPLLRVASVVPPVRRQPSLRRLSVARRLLLVRYAPATRRAWT